ncbi:MBOAT family protein [Bacteroides sp. 519]|uniref:MBOAT family O-acyltransferase n=1 Tax=Bacteroides sp. 519 TaxID=2302937 RepID=UPI0013D01FB8|nr:MBOAT family protein [Bacteroides sp. 519]NDV60234.1 MBOAT family protein [Bacteroides sp. 519]
MLFNSLNFAIFLVTVFLLYWFVFKNNLKFQNLFLVVVSYVFYSFWDWRFLLLIIISTLTDYVLGILIDTASNQPRKKLLLSVSVITNLSILGFFKYCNFFIDNFKEVLSLLGYHANVNTLNIILPVGISFYTFQTMSYTIDIYRGQAKATKDFFAFSAFVSFFPQLAAGPIERAVNFLPQFTRERTFDYSKAVDGVRQMLWGFFKKVVIADNCAELANQIFNNSEHYSGSTLLLGAVFFAFQIYGDFSGYSDMAIGMSRLFGFELKRNFAFPYFSRDIAEFWRRWHISLSTWFRDYIYVPLGGSRGGKWMKIRNTFVIFLVSGFWHGANWTFLAWGALNALYFIPLMLANRNRQHIEIVAFGKSLPSVGEFVSIAITFALTVLAWVLFRADSMAHAVSCYSKIFSFSLFTMPQVTPSLMVMLLLFFFVLVEWIGRGNEYAIEKLGLRWNRTFRYSMYFSIALAAFWFSGKEQEFIYFQF